MSVFIHDTVTFVVHRSEKYAAAVAQFRSSLPEEFRPLVIGPVPTVVNMLEIYAFLPDGSKEGWYDSDMGDAFRQQFIGLFGDYEDGVSVRFGPDLEHGPITTALSEEKD